MLPRLLQLQIWTVCVKDESGGTAAAARRKIMQEWDCQSSFAGLQLAACFSFLFHSIFLSQDSQHLSQDFHLVCYITRASCSGRNSGPHRRGEKRDWRRGLKGVGEVIRENSWVLRGRVWSYIITPHHKHQLQCFWGYNSVQGSNS